MNPPPDLVILGASTRAAATSALRAGIQPICIDDYGDRDLAVVATLASAAGRDRIELFEELVAGQSGVSWLYTGPIENQPELVERLSARYRLLGNPASVLRAVRDPFRVAATLRRAGLVHPDVRALGSRLPRDGLWLVKPFASGGGRHIAPLGPVARDHEEPCYVQQFIAGTSGSALFVASREGTRFAGATRQLHGGPAGRFAYRGNVGPITVEADLERRLIRLGDVLARGFGLRGLFGVDFILSDGVPWPVEVNPRYTASVEVIELASSRSLLLDHLAVFDRSMESGRRLSAPPRIVGKEILYAERSLVVPEIPWAAVNAHDPFAVPDIADVPWPGTEIRRGEPVMTVFAEGLDEEACLRRLAERSSCWRTLLEAGVLLLDGDAAGPEPDHLPGEVHDP